MSFEARFPEVATIKYSVIHRRSNDSRPVEAAFF
jgi:hypothetical protein